MNTAFYLRLSLADGDLGKDGKDESNSIENQRILLQNYMQITKMPDENVSEYIDDGHSGLNFDRPAFKRMIEDAKAGKIDTIIVKDDCVNIELKSESPQKAGFCDVSSVF